MLPRHTEFEISIDRTERHTIVAVSNQFGKSERSYENGNYMANFLIDRKDEVIAKIENLVAVKGTSVIIYGDSLWLPIPPRPTDALFVGDEPTRTTYSDRQGSRDRQMMGYVYCRNNIYEFTGSDMPGKCIIEKSSSTKNGKWSYTYYELLLAPGYKFGEKRQDWDSGMYVNDLKSIKTVAADLELEGVFDEAVERFLWCDMPHTFERYYDFQEKRESIFESTGCDSMIDFVYDHSDGTRKQGFKYLLIDGEVWHKHMNPMPEKVIIEDWTSKVYKLKIASNCDIETLYEWNYGDDSMEKRGYKRVAHEPGQDPFMEK